MRMIILLRIDILFFKNYIMAEKKTKQHPCSIRYNVYRKDKKFVGYDSTKKEKIEKEIKGTVLNVVDAFRSVGDWTKDSEKIYCNEVGDLKEDLDVYVYRDNKREPIAKGKWKQIKEDVNDVGWRLKLNVYSMNSDGMLECYSLSWASMIPFLNDYQKDFENKVFQIQWVKEWENNGFKCYSFEMKSRDIKKDEKESKEDAKMNIYAYLNNAEFTVKEDKKEEENFPF